MSYCRSNGKESDVYLIGTGTCLECFGADWKMEQENPVHDKFMAKSYHNVAANGVLVDSHEAMDVVEWVPQSDGTKLSKMPDWFLEKYPHPWEMVQEGEHEAHDDFTTTSRAEMIAHLEEHAAAGHKVPDYAFARLRQEIEEEGDLYA